jgi:hypothetical protein
MSSITTKDGTQIYYKDEPELEKPYRAHSHATPVPNPVALHDPRLEGPRPIAAEPVASDL